MESRSLQSESVGLTRGSVIGTIWQIAVLALLVTPVVMASIFRTSIQSGLNRAGLLMPALILADDSQRRLIWLGFIGIGVSVLIALFAGLCLGFICLSVRTKTGRLAGWLAILPSRGPVWVFPLFFAIWVDELRAIGTGSDLLLFGWVFWVGWWGATRIAASIKIEAALISQAEWESSRILGASLWQSFRAVIKPRIQSSVCKELKMVAGACLFDPTPVLIWGVSGWPIAELVHSLQRFDGMGVAVATTLTLWMTFVLTVSNGMIQLATGVRAKNSGIETPASSGKFRVMTFSMPFRTMIVVAIWPLILALGLSGVMASKDHDLPQNFMQEIDLISTDSLMNWAWLDGLVSGLGLAIISVVLVGRFGYQGTLSETVWRLTCRWPLGLMITGFTVLVMAFQTIPDGWQDLVFHHPYASILAWELILITFAMAGMGPPFRRKLSEAEIQARTASLEAAIGFGASAWASQRMARKPGTGSDDWRWVAAFFTQWWWIWAAPAWGMIGLILSTSSPMWGSVLSGFAGFTQERQLGLWLLTVAPVFAAGCLKVLIGRKTLLGGKAEPIPRESVR